MSNVYSFDDKILHIESLQLKRTNEILDSRDEAVEALLNYCGDDTMDGMPLLARYWADDQHTEIKHLRGYIHNVDGTMGISIDDICDVDRDEIIEIIQEMLSGLTASTINLGHFNKYYEAEEAIRNYEDAGVEGINLIATYDTIDPNDTNVNVLIGSTLDAGNGQVKGHLVNPSNVQYWELDNEDDRGTYKRQPFSNRMGAYIGALKELTSHDTGGNTQYTGLEADRMEKHEDPTIYITPVMDERRNGGGNWYGTNPVAPRFNSYSILTIDSKYDYSKLGPIDDGSGSGVTEWTKPTIIDPRKYERKIHQALNNSGYVDKDKYVIRKHIPICPKYYSKYYFQGTGVQFEIAPINPGGVLEIYFDKQFFPFRYLRQREGYVNDNWKYESFKTGRKYQLEDIGSTFFNEIMVNNVQLYFQTGTTYNVMQIKNNTAQRTGYYSVTMEYFEFDDDPSECDYVPSTNIVVNYDSVRNNTIQFTAYRSSGITNAPYASDGDLIDYDIFNKYSKQISDEAMFTHIEHTGIQVYPNKKITAETTSPGFRIEGGKIKCYRNSDLKEALMYSLLDNASCTYIKNGTSFYYNDRNIYNCGVTPVKQRKHHEGLNDLFTHTIGGYQGGRFKYKVEFLSRMRRNKTRDNDNWRSEDHYCIFTISFVGFDSDTNKPVFSVRKTESETEISLKAVGFAFVGPDGNKHTGRFGSYEISGATDPSDTTFGTGASEYYITTDQFYVKDEHYGYNHYELYPTYSTMRNIVVKYAVFGFDADLERRPVKFDSDFTNPYNLDFGGVSYDSERFSRTKWRNILVGSNGNIRSNFSRSYFNKCRFTRVYKGIPSEFSEYFYTR